MTTKRIVSIVAVIAVLALALWLQRADEGGAGDNTSAASADAATTAKPAKPNAKPVARTARTAKPAGGHAKKPRRTEPSKRPPANARASKPSATGPQPIVDNVAIKNYGRVIYRGRVDLSATIARIKRGDSFPHRNDGAVFRNRERRLPRKPRGYYREYVHPTRGVRGPGPQRLVVGKSGEWYYTADHYGSFRRIDR